MRGSSSSRRSSVRPFVIVVDRAAGHRGHDCNLGLVGLSSRYSKTRPTISRLNTANTAMTAKTTSLITRM